ncbi:MAG: hypothetical protein JW895_16950, partial [Thermoleophilaceae bacterium]|nr:hypothetical protein [Thermoleophilaceae bacterium]
MERFFDDLERANDSGIQAPGKELHFLVLLAFILSFGFIRTSAHLIKAQVKWWPGNVETKGGTHIHHMVWGILLLMSMGYLGIAVVDESPWAEIVAIGFGIGLGLTLDEFALWLNLKDVYWSQQGRRSIDAVIVAAILAGFGILGLSVWVDAADDVADGVHAAVGTFGILGIALAAVNFAKEKFGVGAVGLIVWPVAFVGAFRLGKPGS